MLSLLPGHLEGIDRVYTGLLEPAQLEALLTALRVIRDEIRPGAVAGAEGAPAPAPATA